MGRSGGNGGMLRSVGGVVRAAGVGGGGGGGCADPFSAASNPIRGTHNKPTSSKLRSLSSTSSSDLPISIAPASSTVPTWPPPLYQCDEWVWVSVDAIEDERANRCIDDRVPSTDEVQSALYALQQVLDLSDSEDTMSRLSTNSEKDVVPLVHRVSSVGSDLDWKEPSPHTMLQTNGSHRVYDAFHLLQTETSVQRMVISLSSDTAVWDAVLNNEAVRELRESYCAAEKNDLQSSDEGSRDPSPTVHIFGWIFDSTKAKLMDLFDKFTKLVDPLFHGEKTTGASAFEERLKSSLMICVVILMIVVVTRASRA